MSGGRVYVCEKKQNERTKQSTLLMTNLKSVKEIKIMPMQNYKKLGENNFETELFLTK